jgi:hypothetical protein
MSKKEMNDIKKTKEPKIHQTRIRMTQTEWDMLSYCAEKLGKTKTDIVSDGVKNIYDNLKKI